MATENLPKSMEAFMREKQRRFRNNVSKEMRGVGQTLVRKYQKVTQPWSSNSKPRFEAQTFVGKDSVQVRVRVAGRNKRIFRYVDEGTKGPYIITARRGKYLRFRGGYDARTQPVARYNVGTGGATGAWVQKQQVTHPGIKARKFTEKFEDEIRPDIVEGIKRAYLQTAD